MISGVTNHASVSVKLMDESAFAGCQENSTCLTVQSVSLVERGYSVGLFS